MLLAKSGKHGVKRRGSLRRGKSVCASRIGHTSFLSASNTTRLTFWHRRDFESGFDGGTLTVSVNGTNYFFVPASAILSGTTYNGTTSTSCPPAGASGVSVP